MLGYPDETLFLVFDILLQTTRARSGVFFTDFEVFGNVVIHCVECLIYLPNRN